MKSKLSALFMCLCILASTSIFSQTLHPPSIGFESGTSPTSYRQLVETAQLIVRGKFGKLLSHQRFYGYDNTTGQDVSKEDYQDRRNLSDEHMVMVGLPMSEFEIIVDEVFKADIDITGNISSGDTLVYRTLDSNTEISQPLFATNVERLFFLRQNPDSKTYGVPGRKFILTGNEDGVYRYLPFDPYGKRTEIFSISKLLEFSPSMRDSDVKQLVLEEAQRQLPN